MIPGTPEYEALVAEINAFNRKSLERIMELPPEKSVVKPPPIPVTSESLLMRAQQFAANVAQYRGVDKTELDFIKLEAGYLRDAIYRFRTEQK